MGDNISLGQLLGASTGTGAAVGICYLVYKLCIRKKFQSKCCGSEINIANQDSNPQAVVGVASPTPPAATPVVPSTPVKGSSATPPVEVPVLSV